MAFKVSVPLLNHLDTTLSFGIYHSFHGSFLKAVFCCVPYFPHDFVQVSEHLHCASFMNVLSLRPGD